MNLSKKHVLSIDLSLKSTGIYDNYIDDVEIYEVAESDVSSRLFLIGDFFRELFNDVIPDLILLEDYAFSRHSQSVTGLAEAHGVIYYVAKRAAVPVITVPINTWKSLTIGARTKKRTKAEKEAYRLQAERFCGIEFLTTDDADACMMYRAVAILCETRPDHRITKEIEAIWR